jgi:lipoprotein
MKKLLFSALVGAMIISCNRDNDDSNPTPQTPTIDDTSILPTKITYSETGKADEVITFSYDENKLVKLTHNNKDVIFTYTGDLITSVRSEDYYIKFGYDANGNLISEYEELYRQGDATTEKNTTYTINGSTITAEQTSGILGTERNTFVSTITYTLDAQKRPIKIVEASEQKDTWGKITQKDNNISTYEYANHHSFLKNIKGLDKLSYSSLTIKKEKINGLVFPFSYTRGELITYLYDQPIGHYPSAEGYTYQTKAAYTLNTNGYPTKIAYKTRDTVTLGLYEDNGYYTIEYNK